MNSFHFVITQKLLAIARESRFTLQIDLMYGTSIDHEKISLIDEKRSAFQPSQPGSIWRTKKKKKVAIYLTHFEGTLFIY